MTKSARLTPHAESTLHDIALWTLDNFGPRQADAYQTELLDRVAALARGELISQRCRSVLARDVPEDLRFIRAGRHLAIYYETETEIVLLDFIHARRDLERRLRKLQR